MTHGSSFRPAVALFLLSAGALCFEVALLRLYAIQQFYHFAFLVVSLAVLGTAAGGTALALRSRPASPARLAVATSISIVLAYGLLNAFPFDSYAVAWDRRQVLILILYFGSAGLPFFFAGWFTGAALAAAGDAPGPTYAASLIGSAAGPLLALLATTLGRLESAILIAAATGLASAAWLSEPKAMRWTAALGSLLLIGLAVQPPPWLHLQLSPNKALAQARTYPGARVAVFRESMSARLEILESAGVHSYPGLSLGYTGDLPAQAGIFLDGDGPWPATALDPDGPTSRDLADALPIGIGCALRPGAEVLVVRSAAGFDAALAVGCGAKSVTLPIDEPLVADALLASYRDYTHSVLEHPRVRWLASNSRSALERTDQSYEIVRFALSDPFRPVASGAFSLTETDDLTLEAFGAAIRRLRPGGLLLVDRWLTTPPAESLRAWTTAVTALRRQGLEPAERVIAFRTLRTSTLIASLDPWTQAELQTVRVFLERNGFDPIYWPRLQSEETNRFIRIPNDPYPDLFHQLLADPDGLIESYPFRVEPATDDRPFFFHFFRWEQTSEALAALGRTWQPFGGSGYLVLLALLLLVIALAGGLLAAAARSRRGRGRLPGDGWIFFGAIGGGFLLVEVSMLQRLTLPLERPTAAFIFVVTTLLLASGVGSRLSDRWPTRPILFALAAMAVALAILLRALLPQILGWPIAGRALLALVFLVPLGLLMGAPFPAGIRRYAAGDRAAVGLAWAVNGAASGVAGVLSSMVMLDLGLTASLILGGLAYLIAGLVFQSPPAQPT